MLVLLTHRPRFSPITFYYCFLPYKCLWWCSHCESARVSLWHSFSLSTSPIACQERSFRSGVKLPGQILIVQSAVVRWPAENETFANRVPTCATNLLNLPVLAKLPFYQLWLFGRPARALRPSPPAFRNRRIHLETHWIELRDQPEQSWFWRRCTANAEYSAYDECRKPQQGFRLRHKHTDKQTDRIIHSRKHTYTRNKKIGRTVCEEGTTISNLRFHRSLRGSFGRASERWCCEWRSETMTMTNNNGSGELTLVVAAAAAQQQEHKAQNEAQQ